MILQAEIMGGFIILTLIIIVIILSIFYMGLFFYIDYNKKNIKNGEKSHYWTNINRMSNGIKYLIFIVIILIGIAAFLY